MPRRISVWPTATHTRTPDGTGIIAAQCLDDRRRQIRRRPTTVPHPAPCWQTRLRSPASAAGPPCPRQTARSAPVQNRSPPLGIPSPTVDQTRCHLGPSRHVADHRTGPKLAATIARFCSLVHRRRRSGLASTSTRATTPVSCTGASPPFAPVLTSPINSQIARRSPPDGYTSVRCGQFPEWSLCVLITGHGRPQCVDRLLPNRIRARTAGSALYSRYVCRKLVAFTCKGMPR